MSRAHGRAALALLVVLAAGARAAEPDAAVEYFEKKVRPILVNHCYACHSADALFHRDDHRQFGHHGGVPKVG